MAVSPLLIASFLGLWQLLSVVCSFNWIVDTFYPVVQLLPDVDSFHPVIECFNSILDNFFSPNYFVSTLSSDLLAFCADFLVSSQLLNISFCFNSFFTPLLVVLYFVTGTFLIAWSLYSFSINFFFQNFKWGYLLLLIDLWIIMIN